MAEKWEDVRDAVVAFVKEQAKSPEAWNQADAEFVRAVAADYGKLAVSLMTASVDQKDAIRHEIKVAQATISNKVSEKTFQAGDSLKRIVKGAFSVIGDFLRSRIPDVLLKISGGG